MDAFYEYMEKQVQGLCNLADDNQNLRALFRNETLRCVFVVEEYFLMMYDLIAFNIRKPTTAKLQRSYLKMQSFVAFIFMSVRFTAMAAALEKDERMKKQGHYKMSYLFQQYDRLL